jgi:hypothetical protein
MNAEQLRGLGGAAFQLGNLVLVTTWAGPLVADPEQWPKTYAILVAGLSGLCASIFLWSLALHWLGTIGRTEEEA